VVVVVEKEMQTNEGEKEKTPAINKCLPFG